MTRKSKKIRKFGTGATRDTDEGKYDYEGFISPIVLEEYGKYMNKHRKLSDGSLRDADNWQKGFGDNHFSVCIKSLIRHVHDLWMFHRGYQGRDTVREALCAIMFNAMAYLHQLLEKELKTNKKK